MQRKKIVITGGVLTPAVAVIAELQKRGGWEIYYLGRKYALEGEKIFSAESKVIPALGVKFIPIAAGRLQRRFTRYTFFSLLRLPLGFCQSLLLLWKIKPCIILSFGGYVSVPVVIAGWLLRISILTHEQTVVFGLASKMNAFFANKVAVSFKESMKHFPKNKVVLTGNPIRKEIFQRKKPDYPLTASPYPLIYITGGNQGAHVINQAVLKVLPGLLEKYIVIHQTGDLDYDNIEQTTNNIEHSLRNRYFATPYIDSQIIGWVLGKASLVVSRAGANTVCEIAALGKPALFIPIPWSYQNEQTKNAQMLVEAGIAEILPQSQLSGKTLLEKISQMMGSLEKYQKNAPGAQTLVCLDAAEKLIDQIEQLLN